MTEPIVAGSGSSGTTPSAYWIAEVIYNVSCR